MCGPRRGRSIALAVAVLAGTALAGSGVGLGGPGTARGQDLQGQVNEKRAQLEDAQGKEGVLTTEISAYTSKLRRLEREVAELRNREAVVQEELDAKQAELDRERTRLGVLRERLRRSIHLLEDRLVSIYKSDEPDVLTVVLQSDGFEDLLARYEYLSRIEEQDSEIVGRVRDLKEETLRAVESVREARDVIAEKRRELASTRSQLESRESDLSAVRGDRRKTLAGVETHIERLEGDISGLEGRIQSQLQAVPAAPLPVGPIQGGSAGFIWPVNGPVTSGFGQRWGRLHAGVDISSPAGTPIRAAKAGSIVLASPYGGYGNYTCISHGGGLSTCYAHQSRYAVTSGSVEQGQVIGYVGCTGNCFGNHLHFEVRINGSPVDPMGYL
jgi:murein DD-endopeptidase MepM/ murein hydrolase activator NlpD